MVAEEMMPKKVSKTNKRSEANCMRVFTQNLFGRIPFVLSILMVIATQAFAGDGIEWERIRFTPSVTLSETYSDNIYLANENEDSDYVTSISPELSLDFAVAPRNYFTLAYRGEFLSYADSENFKDNFHLGSLSFNSETPKGSHFKFGVSAEDTAVQPYSETEESKDYTFQKFYGDVALVLGEITEVGVAYSQDDRDFDEERYSADDFKRGRLDLYVLYKGYTKLPLLLQYRYIDQDNNDQGDLTTDFVSQTIFLGARWRPAARLSGALRVGYTWAQFDESDVDDFNGYAVDTDLVYKFSDITRFSLTIEHAIQQPTRSARESGDYFEFTSVGISMEHKRWERITTRLYVLYWTRDYNDLISQDSIREDTYYRAGLALDYVMRSWCAFSLNLQHQQNQSDIDDEEYTENRIKLGVTFSL